MYDDVLSRLLISFQTQSDKIKLCLEDLLHTVQEGRVPDFRTMESLNGYMSDLRSQYDLIYETAQGLIQCEEIPEKGSDVKTIADAVANSRSSYIREQLRHTESVLRKFINIKSVIEEYAEALVPYQAAAADLLSELREDDIEEQAQQAKAPELFLEAMSISDADRQDKLRIMKEIQKNYPEMEIYLGLLEKKYYIDSQSDCAEFPISTENRGSNTADKEILHIPDLDEEKADESGENDRSEEYLVVNKPKSGMPSASVFKNEIDRISRYAKETKRILPFFTNLGVLSKEQIYQFGICMDAFKSSETAENQVYAAISTLEEKGILARFTAENGDDLYCLSQYTLNGMNKESIRKSKSYFLISVGNINFSAGMEIEKKTADNFYSNNRVLIQYLLMQKKLLAKSQYEKVIESIKWSKDRYQILFFEDGTFYPACLMDSVDTDVSAEYIITSRLGAEKGGKEFCASKKVIIVDDGSGFASIKDQCCRPENEPAPGLPSDGQKPVDTVESLDPPSVGETSVEETVLPEESAVVEDFDDLEKESADDTPEEGSKEQETVATSQTVSVKLTPKDLLEMGRTPSDEEFCSVIHSLLNNEKYDQASIVNAVLLAYGASMIDGYTESQLISAQLRTATTLMLNECNHSSEHLSTIFGNMETETQALALSAYMYALLVPAVMYDYGLKAQTEQYLSDFEVYFKDLSPFKPLFMKLMSIQSVKASGFTPSVISLLGNEAESERFINSLRSKARLCLTVNSPKTRMKALPIMYNSEFGTGSDLYWCMEYISGGKTESDSLELVENILCDYCDVNDGVYRINMDKIAERLNTAWDNANPKNKFKLEYDARDQAIRQYKQRLEIMISWAEHMRNRTANPADIGRLKMLRKELLEMIAGILDNPSWLRVKDANVLVWMLRYMRDYLTDSVSMLSIYSDLLCTGVFSLSDEGVPELSTSVGDIKYYELWRNALRHIVAPRRSTEEIISEILGETLDGDAGLKDNLRQLSLLGKIVDMDETIAEVGEEQRKEAIASANIHTEQFKDQLELAYTYYQINETEKESLAGIMSRYKEIFYEIGDFACWRRFLEALQMQIGEFANGRKKVLRRRLDAKMALDTDSGLLLEADRLLEEDSNFAVAEEYLNRYENGERDLDSLGLSDHDYFGEFLSPQVFDPLYEECMRSKGRTLKSFGWTYLEKKLPKDWTARLRENSQALINSWPMRKDSASPGQVLQLLRGLGIDAISAKSLTGKREEIWQVTVQPSAKGMTDYLHPISAFGTQMKSPLSVIFLYGNYTEQQLVDTITSLNLRAISIVCIDRPIDAASRRYIGEIFHTQKTGQNPFLLVDQVLLLYLAMHQETERMPAMLKCTLPYATYQPFVRDGGPTADEMFCGRTRELATIMDPNGACVVYGGRQLGKTALLEQAESRCSKPDNKAFAVYSTIIRLKTEKEVVSALLRDIRQKTNGTINLKDCETLGDMCSQLNEMFRQGQIVSMHLLIDEVDDFLGAIAEEAYRPLQPLVDLKRETKNNFKFVIAGLHNVCRAKNATKNNGIFGQLGTPLCIKPLSPTDALQLLSRPLSYLGFQIDRYPHLETILTNTNYYPGILQFFGYILVETLTSQYSKYYHAATGNPPFTLQDEQLGAVMNSSDLNKSIKDKFRWSLELDPRYFMIARCITMLYHIYEEDRSSGSWLGFSVNDVMEVARDYDIHCLKDSGYSEYVVLMDEMVEMGILGKPDENRNKYRLRRSSFVDIIGESLDTLEEDIINNNMEE